MESLPPPIAPAPPRNRIPDDANIPAPEPWRQVNAIDRDIRAGRESGQLTRKEARRLRRENSVVGAIADRYAENGLSHSERRELQVRTEVMRDIVRLQRTKPKP